jgi:hypothetical protein
MRNFQPSQLILLSNYRRFCRELKICSDRNFASASRSQISRGFFYFFYFKKNPKHHVRRTLRDNPLTCLIGRRGSDSIVALSVQSKSKVIESSTALKFTLLFSCHPSGLAHFSRHRIILEKIFRANQRRKKNSESRLFLVRRLACVIQFLATRSCFTNYQFWQFVTVSRKITADATVGAREVNSLVSAVRSKFFTGLITVMKCSACSPTLMRLIAPPLIVALDGANLL